MSACDHSESLYGRCTACGMTWEQQAKLRPMTAPVHTVRVKQVRDRHCPWRAYCTCTWQAQADTQQRAELGAERHAHEHAGRIELVTT